MLNISSVSLLNVLRAHQTRLTGHLKLLLRKDIMGCCIIYFLNLGACCNLGDIVSCQCFHSCSMRGSSIPICTGPWRETGRRSVYGEGKQQFKIWCDRIGSDRLGTVGTWRVLTGGGRRLQSRPARLQSDGAKELASGCAAENVPILGFAGPLLIPFVHTHTHTRAQIHARTRTAPEHRDSYKLSSVRDSKRL